MTFRRASTDARSRAGRVRFVAFFVGAATLVGGCADGLQFVRDDRVEFTSPDSGDAVTAPVTFEWESSIPAGQRYALLLRDVNIRPGAPITDLIPRDGSCRVSGDCLSDEALELANVYITDKTSFTVEFLPSLPRDQTLLRVSLILVDDEGRREGESLWYVNIRIDEST